MILCEYIINDINNTVYTSIKRNTEGSSLLQNHFLFFMFYVYFMFSLRDGKKDDGHPEDVVCRCEGPLSS